MAVVNHYPDSDDVPVTDNISVVAIEHNSTKRNIIESLFILSNNTLDHGRDTENISSVYTSLIKKFVN